MLFLPRAHAIPTALNYFSSTVIPANLTKVFFFVIQHVDWTLDGLVIVLLLLIACITLAKICRYRQNYHLYLHVGLGTKSCEIYIMSFKLQPEHYHFSASHYTDSLKVIGYLIPRLMILWPTLHIQSVVTNEAYNLPKTLS